MKAYVIGVFDNDYNCLVEKVRIDREDESSALQYCRENSWSGHSYVILESFEPSAYSEGEYPRRSINDATPAEWDAVSRV
jgi:hypothetical protein